MGERVFVMRSRLTNYEDGAAQPADRAGGVGITSTYSMLAAGNGAAAVRRKEGERKCG